MPAWLPPANFPPKQSPACACACARVKAPSARVAWRWPPSAKPLKKQALFWANPVPPPPPPPPNWQDFAQTGHLPDLAKLTFFARAITPPGRPRRFDTRFFLADAAGLITPPKPKTDGELQESSWFTLADALALDLPSITRDILERLETALATAQAPALVPFQRVKHGKWVCEWL